MFMLIKDIVMGKLYTSATVVFTLMILGLLTIFIYMWAHTAPNMGILPCQLPQAVHDWNHGVDPLVSCQ